MTKDSESEALPWLRASLGEGWTPPVKREL